VLADVRDDVYRVQVLRHPDLVDAVEGKIA
jgi:hypothetical protein